MPIWLILSLCATVVWAIGQILAKKGLAHITPLWNNIFANAFTAIIWIPTVLLLSNFSIQPPSVLTLGIIFLGGSCYMLFFYAISKGDISLTGPLSALYPVSTVILSYIFLHERISLIQLIGILLSLVGVLLIALPQKNFLKTLRKHAVWFIWGISSALISGTGDFFSKMASNQIGAYSQIFYLALIAQLLSVINFIVDKNGRKLPKFTFKKFIPTLLGTAFAITGTMFFLIAFKFGKASLVVPVSSVYPGLVVILAYIFLRERITKQQLGGIIAIIIGIMLIGFNG